MIATMWAYTFVLAGSVAMGFYFVFRWASKPKTTKREASYISLAIFAAVFLLSSISNLAHLYDECCMVNRGESGGPPR